MRLAVRVDLVGVNHWVVWSAGGRARVDWREVVCGLTGGDNGGGVGGSGRDAAADGDMVQKGRCCRTVVAPGGVRGGRSDCHLTRALLGLWISHRLLGGGGGRLNAPP